jgi:hypothetical protein
MSVLGALLRSACFVPRLFLWIVMASSSFPHSQTVAVHIICVDKKQRGEVLDGTSSHVLRIWLPHEAKLCANLETTEEYW